MGIVTSILCSHDSKKQKKNPLHQEFWTFFVFLLLKYHNFFFPNLYRPRQKWTPRPWRPTLSSQKKFSLLFLVFGRVELGHSSTHAESDQKIHSRSNTPASVRQSIVKFVGTSTFGGCYVTTRVNLHRRKMSTHALQKMTRDLFRAMSLAPRQKRPRNVVEIKEAMAAFCGSDSVAISSHCKRSKIILVEVLTEVCSLENIGSWNWRKIAVAWSDSVLLTLRSLVCTWKTCRKRG